MRLTIKYFLTISILVFSLIFSNQVNAEEKVLSEKSTASTTIVLAEINIQDAKIISQKGNTLELSFNINNRQGAQSGVRYGVRVIEKIGKNQKIIDEQVFPEILSVPTNTTISKTVKYIAPVSLEGVYRIYVSVRNYSGLPLGTADLGEVSFSKQMDTVEIQSESCSSKIDKAEVEKKKEGGRNIISKEDKIIISCYVKNNSNEDVFTTPVFETHYRTLYGEEIPHIGEITEPILIRSKEEKLVDLTIPSVVVPQSYITKIFFETRGIKSNYIVMSYTVSGLSATIQNVSLDKNSYKANETAKIAFFWTSSATNKEELTSISLKADIVNKNKKSCIESPINTQMAGVGFIEIPVTISKSCEDPEVTVSLLDANGKILDQKALVFEANEKTNFFSGTVGIIAIVIIILLAIAGLVLYFKNLKSKKDDDNKPTSGHIEGAMLTILFALAVTFIPGGMASADTVFVTPSGTSSSYPWDTTHGVVVLNFNIDKSTYSPGEYVNLETTASYDYYGSDCSSINLSTRSSSNWVSEPIDFYGETIICPNWEYGASNYLYAGSTGGSYYVDISGTVYLRGMYAANVGWQMYYNVSSPASVSITANNTPDQITITSGEPVDIRWTTQNATSSTVCTCSISTGGLCSQSTGLDTNNYPFNAGRFYPTTTTTYTVNCQ